MPASLLNYVEQKKERKPIRARLMEYFKHYPSVGEIRIFLDLEKEGYSADEIDAELTNLIRLGVLEHRNGNYVYLPRFGRIKYGNEKSLTITFNEKAYEVLMELAEKEAALEEAKARLEEILADAAMFLKVMQRLGLVKITGGKVVKP